MAKITKKIWPQYFEKIASGEKKYEFRLANFNVEAGDTIILKEWDPDSEEYTGREIKKDITYVGIYKPDKSHWSKKEVQEHGIHIMSLSDRDSD